MRTVCALGCGTVLDSDAEGVYQRVSGWERRRTSKGGTNAIRLPERQYLWACHACIEAAVAGAAADQLPMF